MKGRDTMEEMGRKAWVYYSHDKKFSILDEDAPNGEGEEFAEEGRFYTLVQLATTAAENKVLRDRVEELEREMMCDVCIGEPLPEGVTCACNGTHKITEVILTVRTNGIRDASRAVAAEAKLAEMGAAVIPRSCHIEGCPLAKAQALAKKGS